MEDNYIIIGKISNTHGIRGGLKVYPLTDDPKRFKKLKSIFVEIDGVLKQYNVISTSLTNKYVIMQLENINTMDEAEKLKGYYLKIHKSQAIKLPKDSYFIFDLIGLEVQTVNGRVLGKITEVLSPGANDVYVVENNNKSTLLPAIKEVIKSVDLENKKMIVELLEGLEEL